MGKMNIFHRGQQLDPEKYQGPPPDVYMKGLSAVLDKRNAMISDCFFCGQRALPTYDIGAMSPQFRCCERCIRDRGLDRLRAGADEATNALRSRDRRPKTCGHCGSAITQPAKKTEVRILCDRCEHERQEAIRAAEAKQTSTNRR